VILENPEFMAEGGTLFDKVISVYDVFLDLDAEESVRQIIQAEGGIPVILATSRSPSRWNGSRS
jgi:hypothetical protein